MMSLRDEMLQARNEAGRLKAKVQAFKDWHKKNPDSHDVYCHGREGGECNCGLGELLAEDK